jgi:hypothetical protein
MITLFKMPDHVFLFDCIDYSLFPLFSCTALICKFSTTRYFNCTLQPSFFLCNTDFRFAFNSVPFLYYLYGHHPGARSVSYGRYRRYPGFDSNLLFERSPPLTRLRPILSFLLHLIIYQTLVSFPFELLLLSCSTLRLLFPILQYASIMKPSNTSPRFLLHQSSPVLFVLSLLAQAGGSISYFYHPRDQRHSLASHQEAKTYCKLFLLFSCCAIQNPKPIIKQLLFCNNIVTTYRLHSFIFGGFLHRNE